MSMNHLARDEGDSWLIDIGGWQITQCIVDYAFTIVCYDPGSSVSFRIERPFVVRDDDGAAHTVDLEADGPAAIVPALRMLHQTIEEARALKDGTLVIRTANGITLTAPPDPQYEAWTISSHHQEISMMSLPGGGLAVWTQP
jgi:hypothetical protein